MFAHFWHTGMAPTTCAVSSLGCLLALALGYEDTSTLLQTVVEAHERGVPDEPDEKPFDGDFDGDFESDFEAEDTIKAEDVKPGDKMEVVVLEGPQAGTWLRCIVKGPGRELGTFDIAIPGAPRSRRFVESVPAAALRRCPDEPEKSDGVLLFWAVSARPYTVDLVTKNIEHLRRTYGGRADVFITHYDGKKSHWLQRDEAWYTRNVQFSEEQLLPKYTSSASSMFFAGEFYPPQVALARTLTPDLLARRQYEWVWLLDEDLDFTGANLTRLFEDAQKTGALIVSPAVEFEDRISPGPFQRLYKTGCNKGHEMCFVHMPKPSCEFRYVNFIEAMFPLIKPEALTELSTCQECAFQIDRIWCSRTSRELWHEQKEACAILDQVSVVHTNGKTLRKWEAAEMVGSNGHLSSLHPLDWVGPGGVEEYRCVH